MPALLPMVTTSLTIHVSTFMDYGIPNIFLDVKPQSIVLIHIRRTGNLNGGVISKSLIMVKLGFGKVYNRVTMEAERANYQIIFEGSIRRLHIRMYGHNENGAC
jgi:hypothetical protein